MYLVISLFVGVMGNLDIFLCAVLHFANFLLWVCVNINIRIIFKRRKNTRGKEFFKYISCWILTITFPEQEDSNNWRWNLEQPIDLR